MVSERCPLYPQKQTFVAAIGMSALCQKQTKCNATKRVLTVTAQRSKIVKRDF